MRGVTVLFSLLLLPYLEGVDEKKGLTDLQIAVENGQPDIVRAIIEAG